MKHLPLSVDLLVLPYLRNIERLVALSGIWYFQTRYFESVGRWRPKMISFLI